MPFFAVHNHQLISPEDIYKYNIDKSSDFQCFHCNGSLQFRQSRNGDNEYSEHFYHPNTVKDTHVECENAVSQRYHNRKDPSQRWHTTLSNLVKPECREVIRYNPETNKKHIVDAYCPVNSVGFEFQCSKISEEDIQSRDATTELDWIFNCEHQYIRLITVGNFAVCEIPHDSWEKAVKVVKNSVYLWTGTSTLIHLTDRNSYRIEIEGRIRNVWIGRPCSFEEVDDILCLTNVFTEEGKQFLRSLPQLTTRPIFAIHARCTQSMYLLDDIHRNYVKTHTFADKSILAIKSVAGSGKTTTLLDIAKRNASKRILYIAYNKAIVEEVTRKSKKEGLKNMDMRTFDSLTYKTYELVNGHKPNIVKITPQTVGEEYQWLKTQPYEVRKKIADIFNDFCRNIKFMDTISYADHILGKRYAILNTLWERSKMNQLITYESLRKICLLKNWFSYLNKSYDLVLIDETQDFDPVMLKLFLDQVTIPRVFVGDPRQSIYEWRGCINGFDYLPQSSLILEFYSTYRIGSPACEDIRNQFVDCWMIPKAPHETILTEDETVLEGNRYTYLFRTWQRLLTTATTLSSIYIPHFEDHVTKLYRLHDLVSRGVHIKDEDSEDLPRFLKSLSRSDLDVLIQKVQQNVVSKNDCIVKLQTIHSYKGLEDDYVRIASDDDEDDECIRYVALTRGRKYIVRD